MPIPNKLHELLYEEYRPEWQMGHSERIALIWLMGRIQPEVAIEIGTAQGGSLQAISRYAKRVFTLDYEPSYPEDLPEREHHVEFVTGRSQETLPPLLKKLMRENAALEFVLVDGDHSREGVRADVTSLLEFIPRRPLYLLMHDSFNPVVRAGILDVDWEAMPHVHFVDLDFVPGSPLKDPVVDQRLWGGFGLAVLLPEPRAIPLSIVGQTTDAESASLEETRIRVLMEEAADRDQRLGQAVEECDRWYQEAIRTGDALKKIREQKLFRLAGRLGLIRDPMKASAY